MTPITFFILPNDLLSQPIRLHVPLAGSRRIIMVLVSFSKSKIYFVLWSLKQATPFLSLQLSAHPVRCLILLLRHSLTWLLPLELSSWTSLVSENLHSGGNLFYVLW